MGSQQSEEQASQQGGNVVGQRGLPLATFLYRRRFLLSGVVLLAIALLFGMGAGRVVRFSADVAQLADTSNGSGAVKPLFFDPSMDAWFGEKDAAVETFYEIEDTFVAEDYVMVALEAGESPLGVFAPEVLAQVTRLTDNFLTVPGVRHVRSLCYNPWIRWGEIESEEGFDPEVGLIISDLVEGDPLKLSEDEILERMIATLGAERTATRVGREKVQAILGSDADFADHIGEPLLLGTILNESATTTVIQVQVIRPRTDPEQVASVFGEGPTAEAAPNLSSIEQQRATLRGIEHFLRLERGLALPTPERAELVSWIDSLPIGEKRDSLQL